MIRFSHEEKRLLDGYLMALTLDDSVRAAYRAGEVTARETRAAHEQLNVARNKYWSHVQRHNCRES